MLDLLNSDRFIDIAPAQVFAQLLDEGVYLRSVSTMYRLLHANKQVRDRRNLARHPVYRVNASELAIRYTLTNVMA